MKRFANAFVGEWILLGGSAAAELPASIATPDGAARDAPRPRDAPLDAIVIAVDGPDAALVKTFAPRVAAWASGQVNRAPGTVGRRATSTTCASST